MYLFLIFLLIYFKILLNILSVMSSRIILRSFKPKVLSHNDNYEYNIDGEHFFSFFVANIPYTVKSLKALHHIQAMLDFKRCRVSHQRRPIAKILKVDILHYFTFPTEQIKKIFEFWETGVFFLETLYIQSTRVREVRLCYVTRYEENSAHFFDVLLLCVFIHCRENLGV